MLQEVLLSHLPVVLFTDYLSQTPRLGQRAEKLQWVSNNTPVSLPVDDLHLESEFSVIL